MSGWAQRTVSSLLTDASPGFASGEDLDDGTFQIRMNNVTSDGALDLKKRRRVTLKGKRNGDLLLKPGDVLFNSTNSPELVGKSALFPGIDEPATFSNHFVRLRPIEAALDGSFLSRWLHLQFQRGVFRGLCKQWVNQATVSRDLLLALELPVPPLAEQRRIAAILDQADALRAKRREALAQLDSLTQSIYIEMFGSARSSSEGLTRVRLDQAFWFQEGPGVRKWQFTSSGVKLLNVGNIEKDGSINLSKTDRHISLDEANGKYKHFLVDDGDLVIASSGVSFDADGLLRTRGGFVRQDQLPLCMNTSTIRFKSKGSYSSLHYLRIWLDSIDFRSQITRLVTGSAQQNFGPSHLAQLEITLPTPSQLRAFLERVEAIEKLKLANRAALLKCDELFASLQHRAFAGQLCA